MRTTSRLKIISILILCLAAFSCQQIVKGAPSEDKTDSLCKEDGIVLQRNTKSIERDSIPDDWQEQICYAYDSDSWFYKYLNQNNAVFDNAEMGKIFKTLFENDSVLDMTVRGWLPLRDILKRYDIAFF